MNDDKNLVIRNEEENDELIVLDKKGLIDFIKDKLKDNLEASISVKKDKESGDIGLSFNLSFKDDKINK